MGPDALVRMANQIADFFKSQPEEKAAAAIADHIRKFWDPRMRRSLAEHLAAGGEGLKPLALKGVMQLEKAPKPAP